MFQHLLVPLDGSTLAESVLPHAVALSAAPDVRLTLLQVLDENASALVGQVADPLACLLRKSEAESYLDDLARRLRDVGISATTVVSEGEAATTILDFARARDVDLILVGSHGQGGLSGWNMGSVAQKILLHANRSLLIVRTYLPQPEHVSGLRYRRLLVPLDGSARAEHVLPFVTRLVHEHKARPLLIHVVRRPEMPRRLPTGSEERDLIERLTAHQTEWARAYLDDLQAHLPGTVETRLYVSDGIPATLYEVAQAEQVDLVVLSAHGYSEQRRWPFGSVSSNFIFYGTIPLLIVQDMPAEAIEPSAAAQMVRERQGH